MIIRLLISAADILGRTPLPSHELAVRCLGAVIFYLKYCLADTEILSLGLIHEYQPPDAISEINRALAQPFYERQVNMVSNPISCFACLLLFYYLN